MEGSIFSILPLLFLIILGLPAMIPNFTGKLQFAGGKSVWIWGFLVLSMQKGSDSSGFSNFHPRGPTSGPDGLWQWHSKLCGNLGN